MFSCLFHCLDVHLYSEHADKITGHTLPSPPASSVPWQLVNVILLRLWASKWAGRSYHFKVNIHSYSEEIPVSLPRDFFERRGRHINWKICHLKGKYRSELVITGIWGSVRSSSLLLLNKNLDRKKLLTSCLDWAVSEFMCAWLCVASFPHRGSRAVCVGVRNSKVTDTGCLEGDLNAHLNTPFVGHSDS